MYNKNFLNAIRKNKEFKGCIKGKIVLDVGSGTGHLIPLFLQCKAKKVLSLEIYEDRIENQKNFFDTIKNNAIKSLAKNRVEYINSNFLEFLDSVQPEYDTVVLSECLYELTNYMTDFEQRIRTSYETEKNYTDKIFNKIKNKNIIIHQGNYSLTNDPRNFIDTDYIKILTNLGYSKIEKTEHVSINNKFIIVAIP